MSKRRPHAIRVPAPTFRFWKTAGLILLFGIVFLWVSILLIPAMTGIGMSARTANRIPLAGFFFGLACGFRIAMSANAGANVMLLFAPLLVGGVFWMFALFLEALLVTSFDVNEETADYLPLVAFCVGGVLGALPAFGVVVDLFGRTRARLRK